MDSIRRPVIGLVTAPTDGAAALARAIVQRRLAACVNVVPAVESVFWWQGKVQQESESLLIAKTTLAMIEALNAALVDLHPYDTFELVVMPIEGGNPAYLDWIEASV